MLFAQVAFEGEGAHGADVAECFGEDCVGRSGGVVASLLPVARDGFEGPSDGVHERCGRETHRSELPAQNKAPGSSHRSHDDSDEDVARKAT